MLEGCAHSAVSGLHLVQKTLELHLCGALSSCTSTWSAPGPALTIASQCSCGCLGMCAPQEQELTIVGQPMVDKVLQGLNATTFAYSQSGTLTMTCPVSMAGRTCI
jgi:hypothetical protein